MLSKRSLCHQNMSFHEQKNIKPLVPAPVRAKKSSSLHQKKNKNINSLTYWPRSLCDIKKRCDEAHKERFAET